MGDLGIGCALSCYWAFAYDSYTYYLHESIWFLCSLVRITLSIGGICPQLCHGLHSFWDEHMVSISFVFFEFQGHEYHLSSRVPEKYISSHHWHICSWNLGMYPSIRSLSCTSRYILGCVFVDESEKFLGLVCDWRLSPRWASSLWFPQFPSQHGFRGDSVFHFPLK